MQLPALMDKQGQRRGKPWAVLCAPQDVLGLMVLQLQQFPFLFWEMGLGELPGSQHSLGRHSSAPAGSEGVQSSVPQFLPQLRAQNPPPDTAHIFYKVCFYTEMLLQHQTFHILSRIETTAEFLAHTHRLQLKLCSEFYKANNCHLKIASSITLITRLRGVFWS